MRPSNLETKCHAISFAESSAMSAILGGPQRRFASRAKPLALLELTRTRGASGWAAENAENSVVSRDR